MQFIVLNEYNDLIPLIDHTGSSELCMYLSAGTVPLTEHNLHNFIIVMRAVVQATPPSTH